MSIYGFNGSMHAEAGAFFRGIKATGESQRARGKRSHGPGKTSMYYRRTRDWRT